MTANTDSALTAFLQRLVQQRSLSGEEQAVIALAEREMRALGFARVFTDANGSLIGVVEGAAPGPTLLLDAHGDTVGITAPEAWTHDPFAAQIAEGRVYGRGTADMKGALAAMIYAAGTLDRQRIAGKVAVSVTVMEEVMEGIALQTVLDTLKPDFVVIGESTDLNLNHGGRGRAEIRLEAIGRPAHSSNPQAGINAVHRMLPAIHAIEALPPRADAFLGKGIMALTDIISDPYPGYSVIPGRCTVTYDRRLLAGESIESLTRELQALPALREVGVQVVTGEHTTYTGAVLRAPKFFPAWKFEAAHPFVQAALNGLRAAGLTPALGAYSFCTNAAASAGMYGIPTVGFGPSQETMAHIIDEYVEIAHLSAAARGYSGIIYSVLKQ
ncbi:MAG: YgeY family selenium metabolism-linked hydrolase [Chloroflexi bacterium]|nr:YgeY family selenium metabolism-linked hydrolase [Chloroflexota bacterium]